MNATAASMATMTALPFQTVRGFEVFPDPLDHDQPTDEVVVTTRRGLVRVALVATEVAVRFQREGVSHDPMAWMLAPRSLFDGAAAVDACVRRDACLRGVLVHGLSLGLDARPEEIDGLVEDENGQGVHAEDGTDVIAAGVADDRVGTPTGRENVLPFVARADAGLRLYTATVVANDGFETVQAFHASLAAEEAEIAGRLYMRMGAASAAAVIVEGFDPGVPLVAALVSPAICDTLALVAAEPGSPLAAGLDLNIEQRFIG